MSDESYSEKRNELLHMLGYMTEDEVYCVLSGLESFERLDEAMRIIERKDFPQCHVIREKTAYRPLDWLYSIQDIRHWIESRKIPKKNLNVQ